jgi:predicted nucleotidyltransferase component of viral defense system
MMHPESEVQGMITFGEMRRLSREWQMDVGTVENIYATNWVLKGMFDHPFLSRHLILRGSSALRHAYSAEYPDSASPEFLSIMALGDTPVRAAMAVALHDAADASGLRLSIASFEHGTGKIEYTGPLGRRSAAQPRIVMTIVTGQHYLEPVRRPLVHPYGDKCTTTVSAIALEEFVAERLAVLAHNPRARDVFDLWFVLEHISENLDIAKTCAIAQEIMLAKNLTPPAPEAPFNPAHRQVLERTWENALRTTRAHPPFDQVEKNLSHVLQALALQ